MGARDVLVGHSKHSLPLRRTCCETECEPHGGVWPNRCFTVCNLLCVAVRCRVVRCDLQVTSSYSLSHGGTAVNSFIHESDYIEVDDGMFNLSVQAASKNKNKNKKKKGAQAWEVGHFEESSF